jgi:hypothetical protein
MPFQVRIDLIGRQMIRILGWKIKDGVLENHRFSLMFFFPQLETFICRILQGNSHCYVWLRKVSRWRTKQAETPSLTMEHLTSFTSATGWLWQLPLCGGAVWIPLEPCGLWPTTTVTWEHAAGEIIWWNRDPVWCTLWLFNIAMENHHFQ